MPHRASLPTDTLSLAYNHTVEQKSRSKSHASAHRKHNDHFAGLHRMGRIVTSVFDVGRHKQYDYYVPETKTKTRPEPSVTLNPPEAPGTGSKSTSRSSSITADSTHAPADIVSMLEEPSGMHSRRSSAQSVTGKKHRRDAMSVSLPNGDHHK